MKYYEIHTMSQADRAGRLTSMDRRPDVAGWSKAARFDTYMDALDFAVEWNELNNFDKLISTYEIVEKTPMAVDDTLQVVKSAAPSRVVPSPVKALLDGDPVPYLEDRIEFLLSRLEDLVDAASDTLDGDYPTSELEYQIGIATDIINGEA